MKNRLKAMSLHIDYQIMSMGINSHEGIFFVKKILSSLQNYMFLSKILSWLLAASVAANIYLIISSGN